MDKSVYITLLCSSSAVLAFGRFEVGLLILGAAVGIGITDALYTRFKA